MDNIQLEFDKKNESEPESPKKILNERTQLTNLQLKCKESSVLANDVQQNGEITDVRHGEEQDGQRSCRCFQQRIIIASLIVVCIVIVIAVTVVVISITRRGHSRTVPTTTLPPTTTDNEWIPVPDSICRNETVATTVMINCFNFIAFALMETDVEKCSYLDVAGICVLDTVEQLYKVNCTLSDQLAVLEANSQQVNDFLQFNITAQCPDLFS